MVLLISCAPTASSIHHKQPALNIMYTVDIDLGSELIVIVSQFVLVIKWLHFTSLLNPPTVLSNIANTVQL